MPIFRLKSTGVDSTEFRSNKKQLTAHVDYSAEWGWTATVLYNDDYLDGFVAKDKKEAIAWINSWDRRIGK